MKMDTPASEEIYEARADSSLFEIWLFLFCKFEINPVLKPVNSVYFMTSKLKYFAVKYYIIFIILNKI